MKRFILVLFLAALTAATYAQATDTTQKLKPTPSQRAARQLKMMEKNLHLTQDQVLQMQVILINRDVAMDSLQNNPAPDRRSNARTRRDIQQDADQKIKALLTDEQKPLYEQWKAQMKEKAKERRENNALSNPQ
jgi:Spy/CpxP family protein refolding chaperone